MTEPTLTEHNGYRKLVLFLSSNAGLGYAPIASGTFGTLAGIPGFYYLSRFSWPLQFITLTAILFLSFWVCDLAGKFYQEADDGRIVIDELIGYLITVAFLPFSWPVAILGFIWFRLFDILKPPPASWFDREMKNGIGVTLDDVIAGIYAAILLRICLALFF
ncbi:MAG: phosphatidylglycerophosphatase A [Deltaproteobacteria bacterium]|jgi:phosphatidylglycerophosphatase A|nr:phosphatidylglycerophosphatase A [Deltaproteobacteria bacterium]MCW8891752.1 phosphatidylglycerophosphatase A [Deltaproteobacteria bacterium]MCW9050642.1 phosphatidylglycerophosphatase A [Deltaproteobacteria bacterium]